LYPIGEIFNKGTFIFLEIPFCKESFDLCNDISAGTDGLVHFKLLRVHTEYGKKNILMKCEIGKQICDLEGAGYAQMGSAVRRHISDILLKEKNSSMGWGNFTGDQIK
jgi:hypothetical protein